VIDEMAPQVFYVNVGAASPWCAPTSSTALLRRRRKSRQVLDHGTRISAPRASSCAMDYVDIQISVDVPMRRPTTQCAGGLLCGGARMDNPCRRVRQFKISVVMTRQNVPQLDALPAREHYGASCD